MTSRAGWTAADVPDQTGRTAVVTGANTGIGYETALALARKGCRVLLACRSLERAAAARERIAQHAPAGQVPEVRHLDLGLLDSVRTFADEVLATEDRLDLLINNAGVMAPPFTTSAEGVELQFAVNHLGHFALTGLLLDRLNATAGARVVTVSSVAHRRGRIDVTNLRGEGTYSPFREYSQSKLANLAFALDLQRRLTRAGVETLSIAAHPGWVPTDLQRHHPVLGKLMYVWHHDAASGARPTLFAATSPDAEPGGYYGPDGLGEYRGAPGPAKITERARDQDTAESLWTVSEEMTGVRYLDD